MLTISRFFRRRHRSLHINLFYHTNSPHNTVFDTFVNHKALDKVHRAFFKSLQREQTKYGKEHIVIEPSIRHLLVLLQNEKFESNHTSQLQSKLPLQLKTRRLLEPVVFHIILSLYYISKKPSLDSKYIQSQSQAQCHYLSQIITRIDKKYKKILENIDCRDALYLVENFGNEITESETSESLKMALSCFNRLSNSKYNVENDLLPWIRSLIAPSITSSCSSLSNLTDIPPFVLGDILLRTPMSKEELHLQLDIWNEYMRPISMAYLEKQSFLKTCINNLVFYCIHYDPSTLFELLKSTYSFYTSPKLGFKVSVTNNDFLNELIWSMAYTSLSGNSSAASSIISSQEYLVNVLSNSGTNEDEISLRLNLRSFMGIVLAINKKSADKGRQLFEFAEKKYFSGQREISSKDMASYNIVKIYLSKTPEELLHHFNNAAVDFFHSSGLWLSFVSKLNQFNLLTSTRSKKIMKELVNNAEKIIITKDIVSILFTPIHSLKTFDELMTIMMAHSNEMVLYHTNILLPRYISLLYSGNDSDEWVQRKYPWDRDILDNSGKPFKGFNSPVEYARHLYGTCFQKKSARIVGVMLEGEAEIEPANVYETYKRELRDNGDLVPNNSCLLALIKAAVQSPPGGPYLFWGDLYATQVVIHEFKSNVQQDVSDTNYKVYPNDKLWRKYIQMLAKFEYISELSDIIKWWEKLKFVPQQKTLNELLVALPEQYANRYIIHFTTLRESSHEETEGCSSWPWPTLSELQNYRNSN
ncbi:hypothetical protein G9P44_005207 [Scheffersomyces stipitis]|nr:hypothetical protein G9P44_005207 [Scheffersomyces stipitis]